MRLPLRDIRARTVEEVESRATKDRAFVERVLARHDAQRSRLALLEERGIGT